MPELTRRRYPERRETEFFGNAGTGLRSNDVRGATITVDPNDKVTPLDRVPLLVRRVLS